MHYLCLLCATGGEEYMAFSCSGKCNPGFKSGGIGIVFAPDVEVESVSHNSNSGIIILISSIVRSRRNRFRFVLTCLFTVTLSSQDISRC